MLIEDKNLYVERFKNSYLLIKLDQVVNLNLSNQLRYFEFEQTAVEVDTINPACSSK